MKSLIVIALEKVCMAIDNNIIPLLPERMQVHWFCPLAELSARLDEKWNTGEWQ